MAKITINPIVGSYASVPALNARLQQIEDELNNKVLYRANPAGEANEMANDVDMAGFQILNAGAFTSDDNYLGASATAPTTTKDGTTLGAAHEGYLYYNSVTDIIMVWNGTAWANISTVPTSAVGVSITDGGGYYVATDVEAALQEIADREAPHIARIWRTAAQTIGTGANTAVQFQNVLFDTDSMADLGTDNTRLTVPAGASKVRVSGHVAFDGNATGFRRCDLGVNGTFLGDGTDHEFSPHATEKTHLTVTSDIRIVTPGDYFQMNVYQDSGGNLDLNANYGVWLEMEIIE